MKRFLKIYLPLILARFILAFLSYGYIHEDEFFQSQEIMARDILKRKAYIPWEFGGDKKGIINADFSVEKGPEFYRSIIHPFLSAGIPYLLKKTADWLNGFLEIFVSGVGNRLFDRLSVFLAPRCWHLALGLFADFLLYHVCLAICVNPFKALVISSSSWLTLVFNTHSFSNVFESFGVLLFLFLLLSKSFFKNDDFDVSQKRVFTLGILFAVFVFIRFTFVIFSAPLILLMAVLNIRSHLSRIDNAFEKKSNNSPSKNLKRKKSFFKRKMPKIKNDLIKLTLKSASIFVFAVFLTSFLLIIIDSLYFKTFVINPRNIFRFQNIFQGRLEITPLNLFRFNSNPENLKQFGEHPWWMHLVVNMTILFGPLYFYHIYNFFRNLIIFFYSKNKKLNKFNLKLNIALNLMVILSIGIFSTAIHQEFRFLLPLFYPLILLNIDFLNSKSKVTLWIIFNVSLTIFYGFFHRCGYIRSLYRLDHYQSSLGIYNDPSSPMKAYYLEMVPLSINENFDIIFVKERNLLLKTICEDSLKNSKNYRKSQIKGDFKVFIVVSKSFDLKNIAEKFFSQNNRWFELVKIDSIWPDYTHEPFPKGLSFLTLEVYLLSI